MSLYDRERELLAQHQDEWLAPLPHLPGITYEFTRGLMRAVAQDGDALRRGVQELAKCPEVRAVRLKRVSGVNSLVKCPHLCHFKSLSLKNTRHGAEALPVLAKCRYLAGLKELSLRYVRLNDEHLKTIKNALHWKGVVRLDLSGTTGNEMDAVLVLVQALNLPGLRELNLTGNKIPAGILRSLRRPAGGKALTTLRMRACSLGYDDIEWLACNAPVSLTSLDLSYNAITSDGAMAILQSKRLRKLRRLKLTCCDVGPYGLNRLWDRFGDGVVV